MFNLVFFISRALNS